MKERKKKGDLNNKTKNLFVTKEIKKQSQSNEWLMGTPVTASS